MNRAAAVDRMSLVAAFHAQEKHGRMRMAGQSAGALTEHGSPFFQRKGADHATETIQADSVADAFSS